MSRAQIVASNPRHRQREVRRASVRDPPQGRVGRPRRLRLRATDRDSQAGHRESARRSGQAPAHVAVHSGGRLRGPPRTAATSWSRAPTRSRATTSPAAAASSRGRTCRLSASRRRRRHCSATPLGDRDSGAARRRRLHLAHAGSRPPACRPGAARPLLLLDAGADGSGRVSFLAARSSFLRRLGGVS